MSINQDQFLKHPNYNARTISVGDMQRRQQDLWCDTFAAAVRAGKEAYTATVLADSAVAAFNTRFIPPDLEVQNPDNKYPFS